MQVKRSKCNLDRYRVSVAPIDTCLHCFQTVSGSLQLKGTSLPYAWG